MHGEVEGRGEGVQFMKGTECACMGVSRGEGVQYINGAECACVTVISWV